MDEEEVKRIAQEVYDDSNSESQFGVARIPVHTHNDIDTPSFPVGNLPGYYKTIQTYIGVAAQTTTLDLSATNVNHITMPAGNITIALSGQRAGQCFIIRVLQDSGGSRLVTWFATIKWAGGSAPTLTTTANKADTFGFEITGTNPNTYDGFIVGQNL